MTALDRLIPLPRKVEVDHVDLVASPAQVWEVVRHADLARTSLIRALFSLRTLPSRLGGHRSADSFRIDDLTSSVQRPGFQVLVDAPPHEVVVGAIGKVWTPDIPFRHVATPEEYLRFDEPDFVKVAWAVRVLARGEHDARVEIELRVDATDEEAWRKFRRYFWLIGPGSHFIRRSLLSSLAKQLGVPEAQESRGIGRRTPPRGWDHRGRFDRQRVTKGQRRLTIARVLPTMAAPGGSNRLDARRAGGHHRQDARAGIQERRRGLTPWGGGYWG